MGNKFLHSAKTAENIREKLFEARQIPGISRELRLSPDCYTSAIRSCPAKRPVGLLFQDAVCGKFEGNAPEKPVSVWLRESK